MTARNRIFAFTALLTLSSHLTHALEPNSVLIDRNVFVPMRDGVRLATDIYRPAGPGRLPIILIRTPYSKDIRYAKRYAEPRFIVQFFNQHGYAVAVQDTRGRFNSEGRFIASGGDAEDGYDTVDWLARQAWSNARIGAYGCSYEGDVQVFMAREKHPALKAMIPQASGSAVGSLGGQYRYFGVRVGGAVEWAQSIGWFGEKGEKVFLRLSADLPQRDYNASAHLWDRVRRAAPIDFWKAAWHLPMKSALSAQGLPPTDFEDHIVRTPTDSYWEGLPYMSRGQTSDVPALFINSWFDFGADMTLLEFNHFRDHSVSKVSRDNQFVIMSPHSHCDFENGASQSTRVGELEVGDTRFDYRQAYLTWFDAWLKEDVPARQAIGRWPKLRYFAMGRNRWQETAAWPLPCSVEKAYFLSSGGRANSLNGDGELRAEPAPQGSPADTFLYDPANPVPSRGGSMCCTGTPDALPGALDQRSVEARTDVLVYTSEELTHEMEVTGIPRVILHVSSDALDTDFTVKLLDVHPDGRAFNLLEGILRARYREGQDRQMWMQPGKVYELTVPFGATSNVFRPGHRIRLEVSSSNFPRFDRNLNVGGVNGEQTRWKTARNTVHHSGQWRSRLILPVAANIPR